MFRHNGLLCVALVTLCIGGVRAATPIPGGANQVRAVSGKVGDTVFNGALRIKIAELREATADDNPSRLAPSPDQKVLVMTILLRNGLHTPFIDLVNYTLADKDDVSVQVPSSEITNANLNIQQGAAARQVAMFLVDKSFVPVKVLVQCATCSTTSPFRSVRFTVPAQSQ